MVPKRAMATTKMDHGRLAWRFLLRGKPATALCTVVVEDILKWDENLQRASGGTPSHGFAGKRRIEQRGKKLDYAKGLMVTTYRGRVRQVSTADPGGIPRELTRFPEQQICRFGWLCELGDSLHQSG